MVLHFLMINGIEFQMATADWRNALYEVLNLGRVTSSNRFDKYRSSPVCSRQGATPNMKASQTGECYTRAWWAWMILSIWQATSVTLRGRVWCGWLLYLRSDTALYPLRPMRAYSRRIVVLSWPQTYSGRTVVWRSLSQTYFSKLQCIQNKLARVLTLWTPNYFLPNSCRRRLNY